MSSEEDFLFTAGAGAGSPAKQQGTTFQRNAPPAKEVAAAVAQLDLEGEITGATAVAGAAVRPGSDAPVEFEPTEVGAAQPAKPAYVEKPSNPVKRGPIAIDADRVARLEKKSFLQRVVDFLFGWMR
ncbi:MAG: hypothetical protein AB7I19_16850 [Planctomycetota bacterium]